MKLKELNNEVEGMIQERKKYKFASKEWYLCDYGLFKIKQTVEAVDRFIDYNLYSLIDDKEWRDWQKLKKLLGLK